MKEVKSGTIGKTTIGWPVGLATFLLGLFGLIIFYINREKWIKSTYRTYLLLWFFWPVGIWYLFKRGEQFSLTAKRAIAGYFIISILFLSTAIVLSISSENKETAHATTFSGSLVGPLAEDIPSSIGVDSQEFSDEQIDKLGEAKDLLDSNPSKSLRILYGTFGAPPYDKNTLKHFHCIFLTHISEKNSEAYDVCLDYMKTNPNNTAAIVHFLSSSYQTTQCSMVADSVDQLLRLRYRDSKYTIEEKAVIAGNSAIYAINCGQIGMNERDLLKYAVLHSGKQVQVYADYLDYLEYITNQKYLSSPTPEALLQEP